MHNHFWEALNESDIMVTLKVSPLIYSHVLQLQYSWSNFFFFFYPFVGWKCSGISCQIGSGKDSSQWGTYSRTHIQETTGLRMRPLPWSQHLGVGSIHFGGFICHLSGIHILPLNCYCTKKKKDECHGYSSSRTCRLKADFNQTLMLIKPELLDSKLSIHLIFQHFTLAIFKLNYAIMNGFIVGKCVYKDTASRSTDIAIWWLATGR